MTAETKLIAVAGIGIAALLLWIWQKGLSAAASSAVGAANQVVGGTVVGIGNVIGIPETNTNDCDKALAEGRYWDASFACTAGRLVKGLFGDNTVSSPGQGADPNSPASSTGTAMPSAASPAPDLGGV